MRMFGQDIEEPAGDTWGLSNLGIVEYGAVLSDMDDIWTSLDRHSDKFELFELGGSLGEFALDDAELESILDWSLDTMETTKIVHHDCMWAGTCIDKYHNGPNACITMPIVTMPTPPVVAQVAPTVQSSLPGRSLLLTAARAPPRVTKAPRKTMAPVAHTRPDTPQSLDEEDHPPFKHNLDIAAFAPNQTSPERILKDYDFDDEEDGEEEEDEEEEEEDDEYEDDEEEYKHETYERRSRDSRTYRENTIASDHSYTLCKTSKQTRCDSLGVQTPSDSEEEEIDVESLGEKLSPGARAAVALPTNPSALDRHQLQCAVASAMVVNRQQRPVRPSPSPRPRKRTRDHSPQQQSSKHRKRPKISKSHSPRQSPPKRRGNSSPNSDSEADNIEKRSLHNDMERQRRIGLKNLFDELKREVPNIREKERAPKVVVLREAAALCMRLQREEREREQLRAKQIRLLARVRNLRLDLAARRPKNA